MERCDLWVLLWLAVVSRASVEIEKSELSVEKLSCDGDRSIRHETARTGVDGDGFDIVMIPHEDFCAFCVLPENYIKKHQ